MLLNLVGYGASILSTIAFLPQALYIIRTKDTTSISLATYIIFVASVVLWFFYGIMLSDWPIILSNFICIISGAVILTYKIIDVLKETKNITE